MRTVAIIQARMGSSRLPGKVLLPLGKKPVLLRIVERLRLASRVDEVVVATGDGAEDAPVRELCEREAVAWFAGSETDVLDRFYQAAKHYSADVVVRVTGDCPFVDPELVDSVLALRQNENLAYSGVAIGKDHPESNRFRFPVGFDAEAFTFMTLEAAWREGNSPDAREHVTYFIWSQPDRFRQKLLYSERDLGGLRLTVDWPEDYELAKRLYERLEQVYGVFHLADVLELLDADAELTTSNRHLVGQEKYRHLWNTITTLDRGGT